MSSTIPQVTENANTLFNGMSEELVLDLTSPAVVLDLDIPLPAEDATNEAFGQISAVTLKDLTEANLDGNGVFDTLMKAATLHLDSQFNKSRITGKEYAEVYLGIMTAVLGQSVSFLTSKDKIRMDALLTREQVKLAQLQSVVAKYEVQLSRLKLLEQKFTTARIQIQAYTAKAEYVTAKIGLVTGFTGIKTGEAQGQLILEQYEAARGQTKDTLSDNVTPITGLIGSQKELVVAQVATANEQIDAARAQTKDTLKDGVTPVSGIVAQDKLIKIAQVKLIDEQYESQRGQTRGTLSNGTAIIGILGAQTDLYRQQITSYQHDSKSKAVKMLLDTWVARKTIDDGVEVPVQLDTAALNASVTNYRAAVGVD